MNKRSRGPRRTDGAAVIVAVLVGIYGSYLVLVGPSVVFVAPDGGTVLSRVPNPVGVVPVTAAALVIVGLASQQERLAWIGTAIGLAFSLLFVFGVGGILIPLTLSLAGLLTIRRLDPDRPRS